MQGSKFGKLTVIAVHGRRADVLCECGTRKAIQINNLKSGATKSCGCLRRETLSNRKGTLYRNGLPQPGIKTNFLTVVECISKRSIKTCKPSYYVVAKCDCGNHVNVRLDDWASGSTKSCGCYRRESAGQRNFTHGETDTELFSIWQHMFERCRHKKGYTELGIEVAAEWLEFLPFKEYVLANLGEKPFGYSLDRIDTFDNYAPGNIRWASNTEQQNNTRKNTWISLNGETHLIGEWAEKLKTDLKQAVKLLRSQGAKFTSIGK